MIGKLIGAMIGKRVVGSNQGARGMMMGALAPMIARRAFSPLGIAFGGAYFGKKMYDKRRARRRGEMIG